MSAIEIIRDVARDLRRQDWLVSRAERIESLIPEIEALKRERDEAIAALRDMRENTTSMGKRLAAYARADAVLAKAGVKQHYCSHGVPADAPCVVCTPTGSNMRKVVKP